MHDIDQLISVCILTFNQAPYIEECINSVLVQKCDWAIEIIVGDDASTDGTTGIVEELACKNPRLRLLTTTRNLGIKGNMKRVLEAARGQYVALLEGDDYWADTGKLQLQLNAMLHTPEANLCASNAFIEVQFLGIRRIYAPHRKLTGREVRSRLLDGWFGIHTCTFFLKSEFVREHLRSPFFRTDIISGDVPLAYHAAVLGPINFLNSHLAVYRIVNGSTMNSGRESDYKLAVSMVRWYATLQSLDKVVMGAVELKSAAIRRMRLSGYRCVSTGDVDICQPLDHQFRFVGYLYHAYRLRRRISLLRMWLFGQSVHSFAKGKDAVS